MKRSSATSKAGRLQKNGKTNDQGLVTSTIDWEVRPGGLLVQKRGLDPANISGPMIKIKVSHDSYYHDLTVPSQSTFGDVKRILANKTGLEPMVQRLLFRGKEKDDDECLHIAGVDDMSKLILLEDPASKERKFEEMMKNQANKAYETVGKTRAEVDKLSEKVVDLEKAVQNGIKIVDKEFVVLTELLMMQLLKLDSIEANGEAREQRRSEVHRIQSFVDKLDNLKARNSFNGFSNYVTASFVTTKWETFDSGVGSLTAPTPLHHSTNAVEDWQLFD
ncbi:hypothetical protein ACH5RR_010236 [Cinchona calisaya]|uniref:BAG family molecular chaperone regulator 4 n=1 Tax=Cinchona calisaya TaxID=153742 RepID=A0ABD3AHQ8_9GENT